MALVIFYFFAINEQKIVLMSNNVMVLQNYFRIIFYKRNHHFIYVFITTLKYNYQQINITVRKRPYHMHTRTQFTR